MRVQICCPSLIHASACTDLIVVLASIASVAASGGLCFSCLQPLHCSDTLLRECLCVCSRIKYDKAPSGLDLSRLPSGDEWLHAGSWAGTNVKSIRMVRVLRALRVISSFKSLRKIILALTQAIFPVIVLFHSNFLHHGLMIRIISFKIYRVTGKLIFRNVELVLEFLLLY